MLNLSKAQENALKALPVNDKDRPDGTSVYTIASLHRLVELGLAEETKTKKGEIRWEATKLGRAAQRELMVTA